MGFGNEALEGEVIGKKFGTVFVAVAVAFRGFSGRLSCRGGRAVGRGFGGLGLLD